MKAAEEIDVVSSLYFSRLSRCLIISRFIRFKSDNKLQRGCVNWNVQVGRDNG